MGSQYSPSGMLKWIKQLGTSDNDYSEGVATDSNGNVCITRVTLGALGGTSKGFEDAWVAEYSPNGSLKWIKQLGTSGIDYSNGIATDSNGNVFITGKTFGALGGTNKGRFDAWAAKFDPQGKQLWLRQDGTLRYDEALGIAVDSNGDMITTGYTDGNFSRD
ncbi:MAG TPA: SBBP repeat-containing protein [Stenomitos sp.]